MPTSSKKPPDDAPPPPNVPMPLSKRHAGWIVGWAIESCAIAINDMETKLVRHRALVDSSPQCVNSFRGLGSALIEDRAEEIETLEQSLREHGLILDFLKRSAARIRDSQHEDFAQGLAEMFKGRMT